MVLLSDDRGYYCYNRLTKETIRIPDEIHALLKEHSKYLSYEEFLDAIKGKHSEQSSLADLEKEVQMLRKLLVALLHHEDCYCRAIQDLFKLSQSVYMELIQKVPYHEEMPEFALLFTHFQRYKMAGFYLSVRVFKIDAQEIVDREAAPQVLENLQAKLCQIEAESTVESEKRNCTFEFIQVVTRLLEKRVDLVKRRLTDTRKRVRGEDEPYAPRLSSSVVATYGSVHLSDYKKQRVLKRSKEVLLDLQAELSQKVVGADILAK